MQDVNGKELKTGQVVEIKNAYFKNDNGLYFIEAAPGDPTTCGNDYTLKRINKNGTLSKTNPICFWPICVFVSDYSKKYEAKRWNQEHATIEVVEPKTREHIEAYFREEAERYDASAKHQAKFGVNNRYYENLVECRDLMLSIADGKQQ